MAEATRRSSRRGSHFNSHLPSSSRPLQAPARASPRLRAALSSRAVDSSSSGPSPAPCHPTRPQSPRRATLSPPSGSIPATSIPDRSTRRCSRRRPTGTRATAAPLRSSRTASRQPAGPRRFSTVICPTSFRPTRHSMRCRPTASRSSPGSLLATPGREASCRPPSLRSTLRKRTKIRSRAFPRTARRIRPWRTFSAASRSPSGSSAAARIRDASSSSADKPNSIASAPADCNHSRIRTDNQRTWPR